MGACFALGQSFGPHMAHRLGLSPAPRGYDLAADITWGIFNVLMCGGLGAWLARRRFDDEGFREQIARDAERDRTSSNVR